ncbi:MAG: hypothetical protein FD124_2016 [Alphaproteobacteria bacterium]|nr:MAG: hypothetical protein FD124_2016 [Alphaproteobacteria bacterium]
MAAQRARGDDPCGEDRRGCEARADEAGLQPHVHAEAVWVERDGLDLHVANGERVRAELARAVEAPAGDQAFVDTRGGVAPDLAAHLPRQRQAVLQAGDGKNEDARPRRNQRPARKADRHENRRHARRHPSEREADEAERKARSVRRHVELQRQKSRTHEEHAPQQALPGAFAADQRADGAPDDNDENRHALARVALDDSGIRVGCAHPVDHQVAARLDDRQADQDDHRREQRGAPECAVLAAACRQSRHEKNAADITAEHLERLFRTRHGGPLIGRRSPTSEGDEGRRRQQEQADAAHVPA